MSRLIDADKLTDERRDFRDIMPICFLPGMEPCVKLTDLLRFIDSEPTAYDVDKVIERLKEEGCITDNAAGNRVVEIIKAGGNSE